MSEKRNITFLLGAGSSLKAGFPTTKAISEAILYGINGEGHFAFYHTSESFFFGRRKAHYLDQLYINECVIPVMKFLSLIKQYILFYYHEPITYEHLYFAIDQILSIHPRVMEYENPITESTIRELENELRIKGYINGNKKQIYKINDIVEMCTLSMKFIKDLLTNILLNKEIGCVNYLHFIDDAFKDDSIDKINIVTLNHDLVLEKFLEDFNLRFSDGFEYRSKYFSIWNPSCFNNRNHKIKLLKLHGSVNWFRIRPYRIDERKTVEIDPNSLEELATTKSNSLVDPWKDEFISKIKYRTDSHVANENSEILTDEHNRRFDIIEGRPKILIGTINKLHDYNHDIYNDIQFLFRKVLSTSDNLIISGYSLGDRGVNNQIIDWLYKDYQRRKILIIDPNIEALRNRFNAVSTKFDFWRANQRLETINAYIENISWTKIKKKLIS